MKTQTNPRSISASFLVIPLLSLALLGACATQPKKTAPSTAAVTLRDFKLTGDFTNGQATFVLTANAQVNDAKGGTLEVLSGTVALTEVAANPHWRARVEQGDFFLEFDRAGEFPIQIHFNAAVRQSNGWNSVNFRVAPSVLQPIELRGLAEDTQFLFSGAARPERKGGEFFSYLPADGAVNLSWRESSREVEGKLFFAVEMLSQVNVGPGLMRQVALLEGKVMQGELSRLTLQLQGAGEVTRVLGGQVLAWQVESFSSSQNENSTSSNTVSRRLVIQFNQPQKNAFSLQVQTQTPLGAFPQSADVLQLRPEGATRFAGHHRVVNDGAVRLEVLQASGLSQISPEQFPESDATRAIFRAEGNQRFAYRFSGADYALRIQADQIEPELGVSQVAAYHFGESELAIEAELELDIREAPLRELLLRVPKNFAIARLNASGLSDYFLTESADESHQQLRLVYGQPVSGRQIVQLRLERNAALNEETWTLPRIEINNAKSVRGHIAVSADAGFRLTPERTQALPEIATAFFPAKVPGIQSAFRLSESNWSAAMRVERLPQTVQADGFHLFSIGEGIAYGSSLINYVISGAPVSAFHVELSPEYFNVEFTGKDIRNWQKTTNGFLVQLHTPVSGAYTLLATYERPFKSQGETLAFTGARPLDAQSEQGHTLVISAYQFQVKAEKISAGLLPLETGEVPAEYRLFFDAPILAAYRYTARPFDLQLSLKPLAQGESLSQVVDRATLVTRISKEGQVLTDVCYLVKNRGNPNFRLTLPPGTDLWSATVNGTSVVPVKDGNANLIPLPQRADPNAILRLDLKLAAKSANAKKVSVAAPVLGAPLMLAEWKLEPDAGQKLIYRRGSLTPASGAADVSGFGQISRMFTGSQGGRAAVLLVAALVLLASAVILWRWATRDGSGKISARYLAGTALGLLAVLLAAIAFVQLADLAGRHRAYVSSQITFLAPIQQANSALNIEVSNVPEKLSAFDAMKIAWPALVTIAVWLLAWLRVEGPVKSLLLVSGWTFLIWAALRIPNGASWALLVLGIYLLLNVIVPALRRLWLLPKKSVPENGPAPAAATAALILFCGFGFAETTHAEQIAAVESPGVEKLVEVKAERLPMAQSVLQQIRIEETFAIATAKIRWRAEKGETLPLLFEPAVLTRVAYPEKSLSLAVAGSSPRFQQLRAEESGTFDVELQYQLRVTQGQEANGFRIPMQPGLVNELELTIENLDVDVLSPEAVSIQRETLGSNTVAKLVMSPAQAWISWKPRSRDVKREKPVFFAELHQLYVPSAGVIEGVHLVNIRPAQGELGEMVFLVPAGATITDVADGNREAAASPSLVSLWRFDPDTRKLRVTFTRPQSRPFTVIARSQFATGPLPFEKSVGLLAVENAANQIGLLGFATGNEVQLDEVNAEELSAINLEDFPATTGQMLASQIPGLTVRRAFRYSDVRATASLKASPVESDVRVETQDTISLSEDRTVLASKATVDITRAGIFRLSFILPAGMDVESISGAALSHWTELKNEDGRVITLHLRGKTIGKHQFDVSLAGPGVKPVNGWAVPRLLLREAGKQRGTLLIVPEQGMRLQVATRDGITQLDPQKSGIRQKGVLAFRVLQTPWQLALDVEKVDPWIQVTSLQHATVNEAQVKVAANLQYQIENTGLKMFRVWLPTNAESVRFTGEHVADFLRVNDAQTNSLQLWEIKLHRRVIGQYLLQASYQTLLPEQAAETLLRGVQVNDVNLQRGFVTVQAGGRLQVRAEESPQALQPTEWQSIPRALQKDLATASANLAYRLVEPAFQLPLKLDRHEAAKLLPARVNNITFSSVISDDGEMLTQVRMEMLPGDKRLLALTLPKDSRFWFAFVNQNGVWPWRERERILIPLEQQAPGGKGIPVEIFYSSRIGKAASHELDLQLLAPQFDLPLEDITWRVYLNEKWCVRDWTGTLQLQRQEIVSRTQAVDLQNYLQQEALMQREKTRDAEELLAMGNALLERGDPQQARRAFQSAYGLSQGDHAFNEDARVQLNNLKLQQALVGLNVRQATVSGEETAPAGRLRELHGRKELAYTQQDAKAIIERNSAEENAALMRLAQRLIQQQDAAVGGAAAIRAAIPEQGRLLTFKRAVVVDQWADLRIGLEASAVKAASWGIKLGTLMVVCAVLVLFGRFAAFAHRN